MTLPDEVQKQLWGENQPTPKLFGVDFNPLLTDPAQNAIVHDTSSPEPKTLIPIQSNLFVTHSK